MVNDIKDKLAAVGALADSTDALERDLALSLLREIYSRIKFGADGLAAAAAETAETVVAAKAAGNSAAETGAPDGVASGPRTTDIADLEGEDCRTAEDPDEEPVKEHIEEPAEQPAEESVKKPVATGTAVEHTNQIQEIPDAAAQPPVTRRRVDPEVIRSLYGTGTEENLAEAEHTLPSRPEFRSAPTLGEAMAAGHRALGETLHGPGSERAAAPEITAGGDAAPSRVLGSSIGLNDRFQMIRDMFDGDAAAFDRTIERLEAFTDMDETVVWIRDNFDWSADSEGAALLIGLLERKLGR